MASVILTSGVVVGNQSLVTNGAYTSYDLTKSGSFPAAGYRVASATLTCTLRNAVWDTITVKAADGTTLGSFGAVGTNGERTCALTTGYDYASLTHVTLYGGGVGTQIAGGSYVTITVEWAYTTSALTLSATSVEAGGTVTASIGAYDAAATHQVRLEFGTKGQTWDVAAGVTAQAVTVPVGWLDQIPTAQSGPARVTLITYSAGVYVGAVAASLTVTAPASAAPTFSASCAPLLTVGGTTYPSMGDGVYVQSKSGCTARITGTPTRKTRWSVLWRKRYIPSRAPTLPPTTARSNRFFSGTRWRNRGCLARSLSTPKIKKVTVLMSTSQAASSPRGEPMKATIRSLCSVGR